MIFIEFRSVIGSIHVFFKNIRFDVTHLLSALEWSRLYANCFRFSILKNFQFSLLSEILKHTTILYAHSIKNKHINSTDVIRGVARFKVTAGEKPEQLSRPSLADRSGKLGGDVAMGSR